MAMEEDKVESEFLEVLDSGWKPFNNDNGCDAIKDWRDGNYKKTVTKEGCGTAKQNKPFLETVNGKWYKRVMVNKGPEYCWKMEDKIVKEETSHTRTTNIKIRATVMIKSETEV
jgi:hypothetical protein